jgi:hypothetical protein
MNTQVQKSKENELKVLADIRKAEKALFEARQSVHKRAIELIEEAAPLVEQLGSFIQVDKVGQLREHFIQLGMQAFTVGRGVPEVQELLSNLVEITSKKNIDASDIARISDILARLKQSLDKKMGTYIDSEKAAQDRSDSITSLTKNLVIQLKDQQSKLISYMADMTTCTIDEDGISAQAKAKINRNSDLLDKAIRMCQAELAEFDDASLARYFFFFLLVILRL